MKNYRPDKNCILTVRFIIAFVSLILLIAVKYFITVSVLVVLISILIASLAFFIMFAYFPLFVKSIEYTATESEIMKRSGVFIKVHQSIRYSSIQYSTIVTTPLSQYTGLNFIVFFVYGGQLRLLFLNHSDASEILELSERKGELPCTTNTPSE